MPVAVHCKGGYRSMIAASLLQRSGFTNLVDLTGGFDAWQDAEPPVAKTEGSAVGQ
jgi:hydroxyacylglutathione hydrolase